MSTDRYDNPAQQPDFRDMKVLYISASQSDTSWHSTPHAHQCSEMFYVIAGRGEFQIEETSFSVQANDMVIVNPHVEHTERRIDGQAMDYMVTGFEGGGFLLENSPDSRYCVFSCGEDGGETSRLMAAILQELKEKREHASIIANKLFEVLCLKLLRNRSLYMKQVPAQSKRRVCERVKEYIDSHYAENITLDILAAVAHLNKYYLAHTFTREFGLSPINYLIQRRIDESHHLLSNTDNAISQISVILGFSSPSYFTQSFQKAEGISPTEYRRRTKQEN